MTEAEWLACEKPWLMLGFLRGRAGERKLRLFACACCRRIWPLLADERSRAGVEVAERYADGLANAAQLTRADNLAARAFQAILWEPNRMAGAAKLAASAAWGVTAAPSEVNPIGGDIVLEMANSAALQIGDAAADQDRERSAQSHLLRDIFGNPFRPVTLDPAWLTPNVVDLARTIYDERAFDRLPILADALLDAGCDSADILDHCRSEGPHARGCWVVDLILGKS